MAIRSPNLFIHFPNRNSQNEITHHSLFLVNIGSRSRSLSPYAHSGSRSMSPCTAVAEVTFSLQCSGEVTIIDDISGVGMAPVLRYESPETLDGSWRKDLWNGHGKAGKRDKPVFPKNPLSIPVYPNKSEIPTYVSLNAQMLMIKTWNLWMSYKILLNVNLKTRKNLW